MGRTQLSPKRLSETKRINIGKIIIFCEGKTEKYYFEYFSEIIKKNKYTDIEIVLESAKGNAQAVLNYADNFLAEEQNNQKYSNYGKYLVFDCDAPPNVQSVIQQSGVYKLLITNYLFETWLLMHFEDVYEKLSKRKIYSSLSKHLANSYSKGSKGKIREIIQNGNVEKAIDNAKTLEQFYKDKNKTVYSNIQDMNPYTSVYVLIEQFMVEISAN